MLLSLELIFYFHLVLMNLILLCMYPQFIGRVVYFLTFFLLAFSHLLKPRSSILFLFLYFPFQPNLLFNHLFQRYLQYLKQTFPLFFASLQLYFPYLIPDHPIKPTSLYLHPVKFPLPSFQQFLNHQSLAIPMMYKYLIKLDYHFPPHLFLLRYL